jgi:hypothetical protein
VGAVGFPPSVLDAFRVVPLGRAGPGAELVRSGRSIFTRDQSTLAGEFPTIAAAEARGARAWAGCRCASAGDRLRGVRLRGAAPSRAEDEAFATALAQQAAQALERAWLFASSARRARAPRRRGGARRSCSASPRRSPARCRSPTWRAP